MEVSDIKKKLSNGKIELQIMLKFRILNLTDFIIPRYEMG